MRRSRVPSQLNCDASINASKKIRFVSPLLQPRINSTNKSINSLHVPSSCSANVLKLIESWNSEDTSISPDPSDTNCGTKFYSFANGKNTEKKPNFSNLITNISEGHSMLCSQPHNNTKINLHTMCVNISNKENDTLSKYFSVVWCKLSKRKHKKWEGDAILITNGHSVRLLDLESKEIGRGSGYKTADLDTLSEGQTLVIGGKEIEVIGSVKEADYHSGRCFRNISVDNSTVVENKQDLPIKPFIQPMMGCDDRLTKYSKVSSFSVLPKFDPLAPGALVMSRPSHDHQIKYNAAGLPVVDVVVDPHICRMLRPHQRDGVAFMYDCVMGMKEYCGEGVILADEMGLGKTVQCIALIWTLLKQGPYGGKPVCKRVLIITPSSLVKNWCKEFKKWLGYERLRIFAVDQHNKVENYAHSPALPVLLLSYEMFVRYVDVLKSIHFDVMICDEGHRLKNNSIKTSSIIASLTTRKRILLTGTPVQNYLEEFYSIIDICNPGILGNMSSFRKIYQDPIVAAARQGADDDEVQLGEERAAELNRLTSLFVLRRTQQVNANYLPPKAELVLFCQPTAEQVALYNKLLSSRLINQCLTASDSALHLTCISALKKLCNHPILLQSKVDDSGDGALYDESFRHQFRSFVRNGLDSVSHCGKMKVVAELLHTLHGDEDICEKIVLVSNSTQTLNLFAQLCSANDYKFLRLDGQTPVSRRQEYVDLFNDHSSPYRIFLLSTKAGGVGLNLIGASRLVLYDTDWNPANDLQAMARIWRDGQRREVFIYRLLTTGTIEEKIYQRQVCKQTIGASVTDAENKKMYFTTEDLRDLFSHVYDTLSLTHDLLQCNCFESIVKSETINDSICNNKEKPVSKSVKRDTVSIAELIKWNHVTGPSPLIDDITNLSEARLVGVNAISSEELARGYYAKSISISRA